MRLTVAVLTAAVVSFVLAATALAQDTRVSSGSPPSPFSQNKQNEPAVAVDANHPNVLAAGANEEIDMEACNAGPDDDCPFTPEVGTSGIYFSTNSGGAWHQPQYTGLTARGCLGSPGDSDPECTPTRGPIGTVPNYDAAGLVSDGDPALAFGPAYRNGRPSWSNGSRLYYANLTYPRSTNTTFKGAEGIGVSYTDNVAAANSGANSAWSTPVVASKQNGGAFSDKEQIWADNASSSKYFGNVYVCYAAFSGVATGGGNGGQPLDVIVSRDGGRSWTDRQVSNATNNAHSRNGFGKSGCTVRTDSQGNVYVFAFQFGFSTTTAAPGKILMFKSTDGGTSWSKPVSLFTAYDTCNYFEPSLGRCVEDGVGGARSDLSPAPSVDIANGAPTGGDATDRIAMTWVDGRDGLNREHVVYTTSTNGGSSWTTPRNVERPGDRGYYSAPAISPNGRDVYLVYNAFTTPFRSSTLGPGNDRELVGVVLHAEGNSTTFGELHRGQPGDARGSSQNDLTAEFLGDYVYAAATRTYGAAVWNDMRNGADCPAIDSYRQALHDEAVASGQRTAEPEEPRGESLADKKPEADSGPQPPDVQQECPANFGNSDIYGGGYPDPTP
jgi:hypothetical protein